jgi:hypothetical protein
LTRFLLRLSLGALALLAACETAAPATPTPTREFSAPTLAPSPDPFSQGPPTDLPPDWEGVGGHSDPTAAALPRDAALPPLPVGTPGAGSGGQPVDITAGDGTLLVGNLYQVVAEADGPRPPGVLLLATDRTSWGGFPARLHAAGYTVLVMELRPGGGAADVRVMLDALATGIADPSRIGVVGAAQGADAALLGCADHPLCLTAALLSPLDAQALLAALPRYNPRPLLAAASLEDAEAYAAAQAIHDAATGDRLLQPLEAAGRGTAILLNRPDMADLLLTWLGRALGQA